MPEITPFFDVLYKALTTKRPYASAGEESLRRRLKQHFPDLVQDQHGNLYTDRTEGKSNTCFMAHLDTVHQESGNQHLTMNDGVLSVEMGGILGADDGAGCAVLAHLMYKGVPGLYLFSTGEECGGVGAVGLQKSSPGFMDDVLRIISFDRRGKHDIVGEQWAGNCASREMVAALAKALDMGHKWAEGTYTDSSEWKGQVKEIVNISVGYEGAHTPAETLDMEYLRKLAEKCVGVDWEALPVIGPAPDTAGHWDRWDRGYATTGSSTYTSQTSEFALDDLVDSVIEEVLDSAYLERGTREYKWVRDAVQNAIERAYERGWEDGEAYADFSPKADGPVIELEYD